MVALAVEAYAASSAECDYKPEVSDVLQQLEKAYSEQDRYEWDKLRADAPRQLRAATNIAIVSSGKSNGADVALRCKLDGIIVGQALLLSAGALTPDAAILSEASRLIDKGAAPRSGSVRQAVQLETPRGSNTPSGYVPSVSGTNMGPGYKSTYGRQPVTTDTKTAMASPQPTSGLPHGRLAYGGRDGMEVDVTSVSGLDTEHAMIGIHQTRANAVAACIGIEKSASPQCVSTMLAIPFKNAVYANCKTGVIVDFRGRKYRYEGPTPPQSEEGGNAKYRIEDLTSSEILTDTTADGYRNIMHLYQDLCPVTAPSDL